MPHGVRPFFVERPLADPWLTPFRSLGQILPQSRPQPGCPPESLDPKPSFQTCHSPKLRHSPV